MNILLLNHYAGAPAYGMEYRPFYVAREWVRLGHAVTIVAASYSHLRSRQPVVNGMFTEEMIDGIRYLWVETPAYAGNGAGRIANCLAFVYKIWRHAKYLQQTVQPDVVIASSTYRFEAYPARRIARRSRAALIYEVRDLWPRTLIEIGGMSRWHPYVIAMQMAENYAYRKADAVVSSLSNAEGYVRKHGLRRRYEYIPNGIDVEEWQTQQSALPAEHARVIAQHRARSQLLLGYAGTHGLANGLETLLEAALHWPAESVAVVLVGDGPKKQALQDAAQRLGLEHVDFLPPVPRAAIPALLANMDVLYLGWPQRPIYQYGISPNKLMDYMMAGKPVVHAVAAAHDPVAASGCGICCTPEDPAALVDSVTRMLHLSPTERDDCGQRGRDYVRQHHAYPVLAQQFLDLMTDLRNLARR